MSKLFSLLQSPDKTVANACVFPAYLDDFIRFVREHGWSYDGEGKPYTVVSGGDRVEVFSYLVSIPGDEAIEAILGWSKLH